MRLNRFLAAAGLGSRRGVEELIKEGRIRVNGRVITDLSTKVNPEDVVKAGNRVLRTQHTIHAVMNKPKGVISTADDEKGRRIIYDFLPEEWPRVFHVGRLDMESEGLLIVTNDGDLSLALTHPRFKVEKEYEVDLDKNFDPSHAAKLLRGFQIIGGRAKMEYVEQIGPRKLQVILTQGIKRQIRLMLYELGYEVERLVRTRIGPVILHKLPPGTWRMLAPAEVEELKGKTKPTTPTARTRRNTLSAIPAEERDFSPPEEEVPRRLSQRGPSDQREQGRGRDRRGPRPDFKASREESRGPRPDARSARPGARAPRSDSRPSRPGAGGPRPDARGPRADFREPGAGPRRPMTDSRGPRSDSHGPRPDSRGPRPDSRGPRPDSRGPRPDSRGPRPDSRGPRPDSRGPRPDRLDPRRSPDAKPDFRRREGGERPFSPRREASVESAEGRGPAPRQGESRGRRSGSGPAPGGGRGGTRPERRDPRSAPRSGRSRS
jgi:23S rRNA pseudouridine2605 synthase